jgi:hypothetical protein
MRKNDPEAVVAALQLYSDKTTVTHKGGTGVEQFTHPNFGVYNDMLRMFVYRQSMPPHQGFTDEHQIQQTDE